MTCFLIQVEYTGGAAPLCPHLKQGEINYEETRY